jgi:hypothetical protein
MKNLILNFLKDNFLKLAICLSIAILFSTKSIAQIKVTSNGNVGIGIGAITSPNPGFKLHIMDYICLGPFNNQSFSKGLVFSRINNPNEFGIAGVDWGIDSDYSGINFWKPFSSPNGGNYKFLIKDDGTIAVGQTNVDATIKMQVSGKIKATQFITGSDFRYKENVTEIKSSIDAIMKLRPMSYTLKAPILSEKESGKPEFNKLEDRIDESFDTKQVHYGFIAQEVKKVLPDLVIGNESEKEFLGIDYNGFIPLLVQSVQDLKTQLDQCNCNTNTNKLALTDFLPIAKLEQNIPNPFKNDTKIAFELPNKFSEAFINVYALDGKQLKSYPLFAGQNGSVTINGNELYPGMYLYALIIDGREIATKKMILTE